MLEGIVLGVLFLFTFIFGFNTGLRISKSKEEITLPNPVVKAVEIVNEAKEAISEQEREARIREGAMNILMFDGTPQKGASE